MARIIDGMENVFVLLDDVLIISTDWHEHLKTLDEFLNRCIQNGITLKPSKTKIAAEAIDYLGFRLSRDGIEPLQEKIQAIIKQPIPKSRRQMRKFIGMTNFYSRFVKNSSRLLAPLYKLCGVSKTPFRLTSNHLKAFEEYKKSLGKYIQLSHRDDSKKLVLMTDRTSAGFTGSLHQIGDDEKLEPLGFVSRSLKPAEQRLEACYQDFLGLVWTLEQFSWEITGQHVLLITDHSSLKRVLNEINRNQPLPVRVNNAHARLSKFNVDTLNKNDIEDMTVTQNVFSKAIILSYRA